jgi:hypothetical protein
LRGDIYNHPPLDGEIRSVGSTITLSALFFSSRLAAKERNIDRDKFQGLHAEEFMQRQISSTVQLILAKE